MTATSTSGTVLIACTSCQKPISPLAEQCPGCGHPNAWTHPLIEQLVQRKDTIPVRQPFTFQWKKAEVWGQTKRRLTWPGRVVGTAGLLCLTLVILVVGFFWIGLVLSLLGGALFQLIAPKLGFYKQDSFRADLYSRQWQSSNEELWAPVRRSLFL